MKRREFLQAGLGAVVAGSLVLGQGTDQSARADTAPDADGLKLSDAGPIYQAGPDRALDLTDAVTLEAWVKADPMPEGGGRILDKLVPGTNNGYLLDTYPGNSLRIIMGSGQCTYAAHLGADHWTHVVGVYSATQKVMKLFVNGKEVASRQDGSFPPMTVSPAAFRVGADPNGDNRFHGHIRRAAIYGRALTGPEIAARAAAGPEKPAVVRGALGEWQFGSQLTRTITPVAGTLALHLVGGNMTFTGEVPAPSSPLSLWYRRPAKEWLEALPIGNGRLGAMVFGGVTTERLQLNEETVWAGGPHNYDSPEGLAALPEIRRLVFAGRWNEAQSLIDAKFMGRPAGQMPYQTVGNLTLTFPDMDTVSDYRRELDLDTAIARVSYTAAGVRYTREAFASAVGQAIVLRLTADKPGQISFTADFDSPQKSGSAALSGDTLALNGISSEAEGIPGSVKFHGAGPRFAGRRSGSYRQRPPDR